MTSYAHKSGTYSRRTHHVDRSFPRLSRESSPRPAQNEPRRPSLVQLPLWRLRLHRRSGSNIFRLSDPSSCCCCRGGGDSGDFRGDLLLRLALCARVSGCQAIFCEKKKNNKKKKKRRDQKNQKILESLVERHTHSRVPQIQISQSLA